MKGCIRMKKLIFKILEYIEEIIESNDLLDSRILVMSDEITELRDEVDKLTREVIKFNCKHTKKQIVQELNEGNSTGYVKCLVCGNYEDFKYEERKEEVEE